MARGTLRVYLGAAPGVGKTVAMLDEGRRRLARGTDVVVAFAETHGRAHTAECLTGLPAVPRRSVSYRGATFGELDLDAVLARQPQVALVDELAHTNVPGSGRHAHRWEDVQELLEAGIDVISTLNVQHLESLNDVVEQITGVPQRETVPDAVVRAADQLELVDMSPEALRRRMAHGNVYPPERVDAALGNYFRVGNLTALRELALLWLADSVEDGLQQYRAEHGITGTWETKERVVVGLTGGPEGDTLVRRAARIAARTRGELLALHVARSDGLSGPGVAALTAQRLLVESLGGSYHSVVGDSVAPALLDFARRVDATQIVLGTSRRHWLAAALTGPGTGASVTRDSGPIDVHLVSHDYSGGAGVRLPQLTGGLTRRRRLAGLLLAAVLLPSLTVTGTELHASLPANLPLYLLVVVLTSLVGGFYPALLSALAGGLLLNYYFTEPRHTFAIHAASNVVAVVTFLLIAVLVSRVVDLAARRSELAARAGAEAETLSTFAGSLLRGESALPALLDRVRETFAMEAAALLRRAERGWTTVAAVGPDAPPTPAAADAAVPVGDGSDEGLDLVLRGHALPAGDQRVLAAFAAHVAVAYRQQQLAEAARAAEPLAESDRQRTALLNAVSHDLRTPLAAAKAAVSSLGADVDWSPGQRRELLETADDALDRLTDLVTNLLDLSRLQVGSLPVAPAAVGLEDVVARALDHVDPDAKIEVDVPADLPAVYADAGLLERVVANVVQNAVRYAPPGSPVRLAGSAHQQRVELRVIDRGPGIDAAEAEAVFKPFQRTDDSPADGAGVGLGLAIARGFAEAMGGSVSAEPTPGGGATVVITLRVAG